MDTLIERCAGIDIGKDEVVACVRTPRPGGRGRVKTTRTFTTFTASLEAMLEWFAAEAVTAVVMEATGSYWKPVWYLLEEHPGWELLLVNAHHVKILPGRKSDVLDAEWLAELLEHGLLRGSFVPPKTIRELRDLTRYRKRMIQAHTSECQRIQKTLEDAGIKLDSVASDVLGVSGRAMLAALVAGERDPEVLAELARGVLRRKLPALRQALRGRFSEHHALLIGLALEHTAHLEAAIGRLDERVDALFATATSEGGVSAVPFTRARDRLDTIPGVGKRAAETIIAEIGVDMSRFPTAAHLASWAGVAPGNNITGGKRGSGKTTKGDVWLIDILTQSAWCAARTRETYLSAQFWRLARRIGKKKAAVAVAHSILVICWHLLRDDTDYDDLGGDYFTRRNTNRQRDRLINQLHNLGYRVTLEQVA
ncbi:IS110 family transposase [Actinomycetospora aeridis]|uniref:IS110 family transposase n=1 Tax=Actinomycetospora aeridis TaxID=3129231 RepID=A0ABU8MXM0_9PSEU